MFISTGSPAIITGLTPASPYTFTLSNASDAANLYLYGPGWVLGKTDCLNWWNNGDGTSIECVSVADTNGEIRIEVRGFDSTDGATFDLDMAAGGIPNEGYHGAPVNITGATPWPGTIYDGPSQYKITGLAAATDYTVTIFNLTDNLGLVVYDEGTYQVPLCSSNQLGIVDETCVVQTTTGELYIWIKIQYGLKGATFSLNVVP